MSDPRTPSPEPSSTPPVEPSTDARRTSGLGIAALIVGGVALLLAFVPFVNYVSGLIALVGIVIGIVGLVQKDRKKGLPIAGTIVSVIALILSIVLAIVYTAGFVSAVNEAVGQGSVAEPLPVPSASASEDAPIEEEATNEAGTRENPLPLGTAIQLSSGGEVTYEIIPGASTLNANDLIAAENEFNEAAPAGSQYAMLPLALTYVGTETGNPFIDFQVSFIGADNNTYESFDTFVVGPSPITDINELFPGAQASGNVVIAIPTEAAEQGVWSISPLLGDPIYFAAQ